LIPSLSNSHQPRRGFNAGQEIVSSFLLQRGNLLGTDSFIEEIAPLLNKQLAATEIPRHQRLAARPTLEMLFKDVHDKASRNEQIYQAIRVHEYTLKEVANFLGLYYSTISVIAKRVTEEKKHQE